MQPLVLDLRTIFIVLGTVILTLGLCMLAYNAMRRTYPGFREWTLTTLFMGLGVFMEGLRAEAVIYSSMVIANGLICSAMALFYEGQKKYMGESSHTYVHAAVVFALVGINEFVFSAIYPNRHVRVVIISLICAAYFLMSLFKTVQAYKSRPEKTYALLIGLEVTAVILLMIRGLVFISHLNATEPIVFEDQINALVMFSLIGFSIFFIFALIQLNSTKLENDLVEIQKLTKESEEEFRLLSEQAIMSIIVLQDGAYKYVNDAAIRLSGYEREEFLRMNYQDMAMLIHPDFREFVIEQGLKKMAGEKNGVVHHYMYKLLTKQGEERWVEQYSKSVIWKGKSADFLTLIDITPQKKAEEELKKREEQYRALVENAMDVIFIAQDEYIKFSNSAIEQVTGYSMDEICAVPIVDLLHADEKDMVIDRHIRRSRGESLPSTYSHRFITKDGQVKWGQLSSVRVEWEGRNATLNFLRDITHQKELEQQVQQAHKLEAIGTLSGGVAHEFNNLLSIILGNVEMAMDDVPAEDEAMEFLEEIKIASKRGEEIVRQLLSFSRPAAPERKLVDVPSSIRETMALLRASIPSYIAFHVDISPECHKVLGDPTQIRQVIINLVNNAAHAMEGASGGLAIRARNVFSRTEEIFFDQVLLPGDYVSLEVKDSGHGIAKEDLGRIFDPFYTTKDVGKGSGMGLSVVQGIMKAHGGGIRISSAPGKGALVECYFPSAGKGAPSQPQKQQETPTGTESILFIDDEPPIVDMIKGRLKRLGYKVTAVESPLEALEMYTQNPAGFDLIITDLTMPDMTGDVLINRLMNVNPDVKTIICTGFNEKIDALKAREMGAKAFLSKPVDRHIMAVTIRQVLKS